MDTSMTEFELGYTVGDTEDDFFSVSTMKKVSRTLEHKATRTTSSKRTVTSDNDASLSSSFSVSISAVPVASSSRRRTPEEQELSPYEDGQQESTLEWAGRMGTTLMGLGIERVPSEQEHQMMLILS
ncbi:expressed unknown protein [Seminavis robusta]|uniref:Uncharacterized protein n=1 Tax=Seminavis robusta TaxID=568900 RepID=A0A9N8E3H6_9STRA|nr:expressed unknown protein [Seminavis robusta]|eukprot:Sro463_g148210.1 n/a (127) ;mRNA; f:28544-28924